MNNSLIKLLLLITGAILFNSIFWQEKIAVNAFFFDIFILAALYYCYSGSFRKPVMKWMVTAHLLTLAAVIIHNTLLSKLAFSSTLLLVAVFSQYEHRSLWYAGASALMNYLMMITNFSAIIRSVKNGKLNFYCTKKTIRFIVFPIIIVFIFLFIYRLANNVFNDMMHAVGIALSHFTDRFFEWFSIERFCFLLFGLFLTGGLLLKSERNKFLARDLVHQDMLDRDQQSASKKTHAPFSSMTRLLMGKFAGGMLALKNENTVGIISLALLNLLLFFINWLDVQYVWFGFTYKQNINLVEYVHEGAGLLIFSIVMAMLLLLFFFRGNLNFYNRSKWLKRGAYLWIVQNMILVVSVFFRDYYYIHAHGLAYKRIGVLVFLILVMSGLVTVFIKINRIKTSYYLLKINAWVVMISFVTASCLHWDEIIMRYNLAHKSSITLDVKFLLSLSDKTLPLIEQHQDVLERSLISTPENDEGDQLYRSSLSAKQFFEYRKKIFFEKQQAYTWLSWNVADDFVKNNLPAQQSITVLKK